MAFKPKVLIVQSDPKLLGLVGEVLNSMGAESVPAKESKQAADFITTQKFDGFFVDRNMTGIDGLQLTRLIRASEHNKECPVVMLADPGDRSALPESFKSGANFFLQKPVTPTQIRRLLNASRGMMLEERRRYQRAPGNFNVICKWGTREEKARCIDISTSGMMLQMETVPDKGEDLELEYALPGSTRNFHMNALVTRLTPEKKVGVHFVQPESADKKEIAEFADRTLGTGVKV